MIQIPLPARDRLLRLMRILEHSDGKPITSGEIEVLTGWASHTIRKDISFLGDGETLGQRPGTSSGYDPGALAPVIRKALGLDRRRRFCVVGLGRLGSAYLNLQASELEEFELAAGFDTSVNRVEILKSRAPLYPSFKMEPVIRRQGIEIALLCVPAGVAQAAAEKLSQAGIRGILNFAPVPLTLPPEVTVRNVYVADELRGLAVAMNKE
jgi:redox-sensing transcriptional repressor